MLTLGGIRVYHTGDSGFTPEMAALSGIDSLIADVRSPYQMSPKQVVQAAQALKPKLVIPVHWVPRERMGIEYIRDSAPAGIQVLLPP